MLTTGILNTMKNNPSIRTPELNEGRATLDERNLPQLKVTNGS